MISLALIAYVFFVGFVAVIISGFSGGFVVVIVSGASFRNRFRLRWLRCRSHYRHLAGCLVAVVILPNCRALVDTLISGLSDVVSDASLPQLFSA